MKITILSSLNDENQKGGAYLRVKAIAEIYQKLGFETEILYHSNYKTFNNIKSIFLPFLFGKSSRVFFKSSEMININSDYLHLDNLRHLNWSFDKKIPIIFNAHNLEYETIFSRKKNLISKLFFKYEVSKLKKANFIWVCSQREKEILKNESAELNKKVYVIPNLVDSSIYKNSKDKNIVSFIGTLDYYPNILAVDYLLTKFFPKIKTSLYKEFEFVIAGRNPIVRHIKLANDLGIKIIANLTQDEIIDLYSKTKILLVPITEGSGTRLKIIEGLFSGSSILSTNLGAEGIKSSKIYYSSIDRFPENFQKIISDEKLLNNDIEESTKNSFDIDQWFIINKTHLQKILSHEN